MAARTRKPDGMSDEEWRKYLIGQLGFEPRDLISEVSVSDREGTRQVEVNQTDGSTSIAKRVGSEIDMELRGPPPRNEDDVEQVLAVLVQHVSAEASPWHFKTRRPHDVETGADGWLVDPDGVETDIQVTRALPDGRLMKALSEGVVKQRASSEAVAAGLLKAATRKAHPKRGSPESRAEVVLALDAGRLPHSVFSTVREHLKQLEAEFGSLGFRAVFLVGRNERRTFRLDGQRKLGRVE